MKLYGDGKTEIRLNVRPAPGKGIKAAAKDEERIKLALFKCGELVPQNPNDEPAEKLLERTLEEKN